MIRNGERDRDAFELPPMPSDLDDFGELLDVVRGRVDAQRTADVKERIGTYEPIYTVDGKWQDEASIHLYVLLLEFAQILVGIAAAALLLFGFWIAAGVTFAVEGVLFLVHRHYKKRKLDPIRAFRRTIVVRPIAVATASRELYAGPLENWQDDATASASGLIVWTEDPELERDPAALHRLARLVASLPHREPADVPEAWHGVRAVVARLYGQDVEVPDEVDWSRPLRLPADEVGNDATFLWESSLGFEEMPNGYLDRVVLLALQAPGGERGTCVLDRYYWWNQRADELTRPTSYFAPEELAAFYGTDDDAADPEGAEADEVAGADGAADEAAAGAGPDATTADARADSAPQP